MTRLALTLALLVLGWSRATHACEPPISPQVFAIEHQVFGKIGHQTIRFGCQDGLLEVEAEEAIEVRIALVTAFTRSGRYHERWRDDRLMWFEGEVEDDQGRSLVSARHESGAVVILGPDGRIEAPETVVPNLPWSEWIAARSLAFDLQSGELLHLIISSAGVEELTFGDQRVIARKLAVRGDRPRELWFDDTGLLKWQLRTHGATVTLTRQALTPR